MVSIITTESFAPNVRYLFRHFKHQKVGGVCMYVGFDMVQGKGAKDKEGSSPGTTQGKGKDKADGRKIKRCHGRK